MSVTALFSKRWGISHWRLTMILWFLIAFRSRKLRRNRGQSEQEDQLAHLFSTGKQRSAGLIPSIMRSMLLCDPFTAAISSKNPQLCH